jgi:hypothetical protein
MASLIEQKMIPRSARVSEKVVFTDMLSITASTATPVRRFCSSSGIPVSQVAADQDLYRPCREQLFGMGAA